MPTTTTRTAVRPWPVALVLASASFLVLFDSQSVATALPSIGAEFRLGPDVLQWVVSLYSLSVGSLLLLGGRVSDLFGHRRALLAGLAVCAGSGLLAGCAPDMAVLLVGRGLQGAAAAFALPAALAAAASTFTREPWRTRVFSVLAFAAWSAGLAGAVLGGLVTVHLGWRWVFLVTVPVAVAAAGLVGWLLPTYVGGRGDRRPLDAWGGLLVAAGLAALILGLSRSAPFVAVGVVVLAAFVIVERRTADPLVPGRLLRSRQMVGGCLAFGAYCTGYSTVIVIVSLYVQDARHMSAVSAGLVLTPVLAGAAVSSSLTGRVLSRFTSRSVVAVALASAAALLAVIAVLSDRGGILGLVPWLALWGVASGPVYVRLTRECVGDAAEADRGTASAMFESMSHVGGAISVAVLMTMLGLGAGYPATEMVGAAVMALGAVITMVVLPRARQ
ncbi:MFS transporter [Kutzneria sp. NPDC051319]|uniref:MFS transporter n=1 Tax=Kutzneria sp. NPDC051319 TaxID=3155047 RepID=UPI00343AB923